MVFKVEDNKINIYMRVYIVIVTIASWKDSSSIIINAIILNHISINNKYSVYVFKTIFPEPQ